MIRYRLRAAVASVAIAFVCALSAFASAANAPAHPWLLVSDVHYDRYARLDKKPNYDEADTDPQLFTSFLDEARRVDPDPPVVVIAGDFLAHRIYKTDATQSMVTLAERFDEAFPHAQFVITLGNNDSNCGDYVPPLGGSFLAAVAKAWAPLVDRHGAAPDFVQTFARDGSYVASLPGSHLRAVVINDNFFTVRYGTGCSNASAPEHVLAALRTTLAATPPGMQNVVLFHVPPGIDAYSTSHLTHGIFVVPFLRPRARDALSAILADRRSHVALAIAGHTHRFSFHIVEMPRSNAVPLLLVPSISPIFGNYPSFLVAPMESGGTLGDITQFAFDGERWARLGDLASVGVPRFTVPDLVKLQSELLKDIAYRDRFANLYEGGAPSEIVPRTWSVYACAMTNITDSAFESCAGKRGYSVLTRRGLGLVVGGILLIVLVAACIYGIRVRLRGRAEIH